MREILFRGKRIDNGKWAYGYLFKIWEYAYILWGTTNDIPNMIEVNPDTICRYTGLMDKNGWRICENDIVSHNMSDTIGKVKWYEGDYVGWCVDDIVIDEQQFTDEMWGECEVVGNVFDDPELLEGGAE